MTEIIWRQLRDTQFRLWKRVRKSGSCANWVNKEKSDKMENGDKNNFTCEKVEHEIASIAFTHSQYIRRKKQGEKISKKRVQIQIHCISHWTMFEWVDMSAITKLDSSVFFFISFNMTCRQLICLTFVHFSFI